MKPFTFSLLFFLFSISFAKAQVSPLDTSGYRMSVISNVKDVAIVTGMSQAEQLQLAVFFQNAENTINAVVSSGGSGTVLAATQTQLILQFQSILSPQELAAYRLQRKDSIYSQVIATTN